MPRRIRMQWLWHLATLRFSVFVFWFQRFHMHTSYGGLLFDPGVCVCVAANWPIGVSSRQHVRRWRAHAMLIWFLSTHRPTNKLLDMSYLRNGVESDTGLYRDNCNCLLW
jgi:hypothetical protein